MKIQIDGKDFFEISDYQYRVMCNEVNEKLFYYEIETLIKFTLDNRFNECYKNLMNEWMPKLSERMDSVPTNPEKLVDLIISQKDYQSRKMRDLLLIK